jgi:sucrose-6-phosphate hydrolase SacC (GH32 family)
MIHTTVIKAKSKEKQEKTDAELSDDEDGYYSGSVILDNGKSYYFYKVKLGKTGSSSSYNYNNYYLFN